MCEEEAVPLSRGILLGCSKKEILPLATTSAFGFDRAANKSSQVEHLQAPRCAISLSCGREAWLCFPRSRKVGIQMSPPWVRMTWQSLFPGSFRLWAESASCAWRAEVPSPCWLRGGLSLVPARFPCVSLTLGLSAPSLSAESSCSQTRFSAFESSWD